MFRMTSLIAMLGAGCIALAACQPETPGPVASPAPGTEAPATCGLAADTVVDEKTLYSAESAYNVAAHAYVSADGTGKLTEATKADLKPLLVQSYNMLGLARSAYQLGDVCRLEDYAANAKDIANTARDILSSK